MGKGRKAGKGKKNRRTGTAEPGPRLTGLLRVNTITCKSKKSHLRDMLLKL